MAFTEEEVRKKLKKLGLGKQGDLSFDHYDDRHHRYRNINWRPGTYVDEGGFDADNYGHPIRSQEEANDTENIYIHGTFKVEDLEAVLWWARMHLGPRKTAKKRAPRKPAAKK